MAKPVFESGFELPEEGNYVLQAKDVKFDKVEKGLTCSVKSEILEGDHAECIGLSVIENYPLYTNFGLSRLLGLGVKTIGLPADKDYPDAYFDDEKTQVRFTGKLKDSIFGGEIKHTSGKKEGSKFANLKKVYTKDEVKKLLAGGAKKDKPATTDTASAAGGSEDKGGDDGW